MTLLDAHGQPIRETAPEAELAALREQLAFLRETWNWQLEAELERDGWQIENAGASIEEPSREALRKAVKFARWAWLKNPLIRRAVDLSASYCFAQGVNVTVNDKDINAVVQAFWTDPQNKSELSGHTEAAEKNRALDTDGELFFVLFVNRSSGAVKVSSLPPDEVQRVITDPNNRKRPHYYERQWAQETFNESDGTTQTETVRALYPDWRYRPAWRRARIGELSVMWDSPVLHVKVGGFSNWRRGWPTVDVSRPYATAYKSFLEDWASIAKALSRFAWKYGGSRSSAETSAVRTKTGTTLGSGAGYGIEMNPAPTVGSMAILPAGRDLTPIKTSGSGISAEDGRQMRIMAISALGFADHFFGDTAQGTLATARSLDRPTELRIRDRQALWANVYRSILSFVLLWAVKAPSGPLRHKGRLQAGDASQAELDTVTWADGVDATIRVDWPPIVERNLGEYFEALSKAAERLPEELVATLMMVALEVDGIDQWLTKLPKRAAVPVAREPGELPGDGDEDERGADGQGAVEAMMIEAVAELRAGLASVLGELGRLKEGHAGTSTQG